MSDIEKGLEAQNRKYTNGKMAIQKAIADNNAESVHILPRILGEIAHENFSSQTEGFLNNGINWMMGQYAAEEIRVLTPQILKLCNWLAERCYNKNTPFDDYYDEEYTALMVNTPECMVLLSATDDFSYVVKIDINNREKFDYKDGSLTKTPLTTYEVHIRCLMDSKGLPSKMKTIKSLNWLSNLEKIKDNSHFRYRDGRDDGYLLTVKQDKYDGKEWTCENALQNYPMLCRVNRHLFQLFAETDCLDD